MQRWPTSVAIALASLAGCGGIVIEPSGDGGPSGGSSSGGGSGGSSSGSGGVSSSGSGGWPDDAGASFDATTADDSGDATMGPGPCGPQPALHPTPQGDIYCGLRADASPLVCQSGQQCCLGGLVGPGMYDPEQCAAWTADGAGCENPEGGAIGIACNQVADCVANGLEGTLACCLQGASGPFVPPNCQFFKASQGTAIVCEGNGLAGNGVGTCVPGEVQICASNADCPAGLQCIAGRWKLFQVGFCM